MQNSPFAANPTQANPMQAVPPSTSQLIAALRGPIVLITLGILLAIDHSGGMRIVRTWPILIIVFGLLKLGEFAANDQPAGTGGL
jgi:hypothetical protein